MKTTSHFIGIAIDSTKLANIFVAVYTYLQQHSAENYVIFQNPLSPHITLYYLEKDLSDFTKNAIQNDIATLTCYKGIFILWFQYFWRWDNRFVLYFETKTDLNLVQYRDFFHQKYQRDFVEDNIFPFSPHITFLKIVDEQAFEQHRENIENIIQNELQKLQNIDINVRKCFLYAVNSTFKEEIQIAL